MKIKPAKTAALGKIDLNARHIVFVDTGKDAIRAVLLQFDLIKDCWQPIEYALEKMNNAETWYAVVKKEGVAVTWTCEKLITT